MDPERLEYEGRLTTSELRAKELRLRLEHLREVIRQTYRRFVPVQEIEAEDGAALAMEFASTQIRYKEVLAEIAALKKALGK
ncbi:MAG: hypothetical protein JRI59_06770 [Deltaproteobacteria bacterium]|nr:hypothetical protein [Deltaproteobacteria bacterium]